MPQELILKIHDSEPAREARAPIGPCSIGRGVENDVLIDTPGVSRRHAVIGHYSDGAQISDCNSQNGTFVNGRRVVGSITLNSGDVISLGGACDITVMTSAGESRPKVKTGVTKPPAGPVNPSTTWPRSAITAPLVAMVSMALIMGIAALAIFARSCRDPETEVETEPMAKSDVKSPSSPAGSIPSDESARLDRIESAVRGLMRRISKDSQVYAFPDASPLREIDQALGQGCKSSPLAAALEIISRNRDEFVSLAGNQITPDLLAYAVLAETDAAATPRKLMDTARLMAPKLISLRNTFGDETADSVLIFVSAYPEGVFPRGAHPMLGRIPSDNPIRERKVWSLARRGKFKPGQYEFVLRFIAYGIIAGNPRECGIALPKLDF